MTRRGRMVANVILAVATVSAIASAALMITSTPTVSKQIPSGSPGHLLFSIRNSDAVAASVTGVTNNANLACTGQTLTPVGGALPRTLQPNEQMQFEASTTGYVNGSNSLSPHDCTYTVSYTEMAGGSGGSVNVDAVFNVNDNGGSSADHVDIQPMMMSFGSQSTTAFEDQELLVTNYTAFTITDLTGTIGGDTSGSIVFESPAACAGSTNCNLNGITFAANDVTAFTIRCKPTIGGPINATIAFTEPSFMLGSSFATCTGVAPSGIAITPKPIDVFAGTPKVVTVANVNGSSTKMTSATITDPANQFAFTTSGCAGSNCLFGGSGEALPTTLTITCTPQMPMTPGTLSVQGSASSDHDSAVLGCYPAGATPTIDVSPLAIDIAMPVAVGSASAPQALTIGNTGGAPLEMVRVAVASTEWSADSCVDADCSVGPGASQVVHLMFTPAGSGQHTAELKVTSDDPKTPEVDVALSASGDGDPGPDSASKIADLYGCDAGRGATCAWPFALALGLTLRRRRGRAVS